MRVFNINKALGYASSGVEYAQRYRRQILAGIDWVDDYYVFTDYVSTNLCVFSDRLGFTRSQVVWIYNFITGRETLPCTLGVEQFVAALGQPHAAPQIFADHVEITVEGSRVRHRVRTLPGDAENRVVDRVETMVGDQLVRVEHYDQTLNNVEHFSENRLVRRVFYTADGRVAATQLYRGGEIARTLITPASPLYRRAARPGRTGPSSFRGDVVLEGRSQLFRYVFAHLISEPDDVVIVDRAVDVIDAIYPMIGNHRLYSIVHAEHFDLKQIEDGVLLWNNHYENVFTRPDMIDALVVSTHRQKQVLEAQLASRAAPPDGPAGEIPVTCIPVGAVTRPAAPSEYDPGAVVTASRLAEEKHLDVVIRAVGVARKVVPELRLDIYGEGNRDRLLAVIEETQAQDHVRLMGHQELDGVLGAYALFVTASTSEGFGLSLLEAMAQGLPIVGFDVDYGNRELVEPGVNGRLVPYVSGDGDAAVTGLADAIVDVLTSGSLDDMRTQSLRKAEAYTVATIQKRWERLLRGEERC